MAIHVALSHRTKYTYDREVNLAPHTIRLRPAPHCRTEVLSYSLTVDPAEHFLNWQQDPHGNYLARLVFPEMAKGLTVDVDLVASLSVINPFDFFLEPGSENYPFTYDAALRRELAPYLKKVTPTKAFAALIASVDRTTPTNAVDFLVALNQRLANEIRYIIRMEPGVQTPDQTLTLKSGSCRDTAWLLVRWLRHLGIAARFVSGYLIQLTPDVRALDGPQGATEDFCDLHAWAEAYLPGAGWVGLDPTSGLLAGEGHLPLAATPSPVTAAAITGAVDPCEATLEHTMSVRRIAESPRVTKPYTEEEWARIAQLGHAVDARLTAGDVRLTMGGEPTFVSIDDMDGAEWNTAALGVRKRELAGTLIRRLRQRFAPGGLLHYGQGKWYPGESLPRWALGCWWRTDGDPIWSDDALIADESRDYGHGPAEAQRFVERLARELAVEAGAAIPAYEDAWYYLWRERRLPTNVDPLASKLDDKEARARLARVFAQGLDHVAGYVLPLRRLDPSDGGPRWVTGRWFVRREHLFLFPGDSPIGYRLPLDSLPWSAPDDRHLIEPPDPFAPQPALPARAAAERAAATTRDAWSGTGRRLAEQEAPRLGDSAKGIVRTAVCVEPRGGRLHIFMPPVVRTEDYLDLIAAVERTADALSLPVVIEGTPPHDDDRLEHFSVTPDPGVIEVNLQPSASWDELVERTTVLYEEARLTRLGTEKFMLDGRHTGTGGGNHIVVGGPSPADSPFLRRPDLLKSLVGYWHNHPSLSYLFSGLFIGPTSQHPRVDEARDDAVRELEIAFTRVREGDVPPWLTDRLFRNLLVDVTGNTHRAEFCIDKLYPPEGAGGRRGLVELRAFEMPPHSRMSLTQQVLLRALIATFWERPYDQPLARWGTGLHDRFLLPHFVAADLEDVLRDLRRAGFPFESNWFAPHLEFRFPLCGAIAREGIHLEIRQALEPWHVLGDEPTAGGTVRYVDSSVERLQVKVQGWTGTRYVLAVNGRAVPLHQTGTVGELVAGVRFRAWQPPESLHPTIPAHAPLVFDVIDTWSERALGGCVYHVSHPGGRSAEQFPVNSYAAEGRRLARFSTLGHRPGVLATPPDERDPEFPLTLDLRRTPATGLAVRPLAEPR